MYRKWGGAGSCLVRSYFNRMCDTYTTLIRTRLCFWMNIKSTMDLVFSVTNTLLIHYYIYIWVKMLDNLVVLWRWADITNPIRIEQSQSPSLFSFYFFRYMYMDIIYKQWTRILKCTYYWNIIEEYCDAIVRCEPWSCSALNRQCVNILENSENKEWYCQSVESR